MIKDKDIQNYFAREVENIPLPTPPRVATPKKSVFGKRICEVALYAAIFLLSFLGIRHTNTIMPQKIEAFSKSTGGSEVIKRTKDTVNKFIVILRRTK